MPLLGRFVKSAEHLLFSKNWNLAKINWSPGFAVFKNKVGLPSPPKKPLTAYMIFCKENRKNVLKDNPSLSSPQQIKVLAEKWSHLSREMKEPYEVSARDSILLYGEAHKKFYENLTEEQKEELARAKAEKRESRRLSKLKKALKESGLPKPASTAYHLFLQSQTKVKASTNQPSEFIKKVAEMWRNLPEGKKKDYEVQAQVHKEKYFLEMQKWKDKLINDGNFSLIKEYEEKKGRSKRSTDVASLSKIEPTSKKNAPKEELEIPKN